MTVTELSTELSVHKSTAFRLLSTLESRGLIDQNGSRGSYQLGFGVVQLAAGAIRKLDLAVISRKTCETLAHEVGETVDISVLDEGMVLTIDQVEGPAAMTTFNWIGQRSPLHATSAGKVFLAHMSPAARDEALSGTLERFTEQTVTNRKALARQLAEVPERGYGVTLEELEVGLAAVAAPVRDLDGQVVAAVSISGPNFRINPDTIEQFAEQAIDAATDISRRNGESKPG